MTKYHIFFIFSLFFGLFSNASNEIDFKISHDDIVERMSVNIGFEFKTDKGITKTEGFLNGNLRWNRVQVITEPHMEFNRGVLWLNHDVLLKHDYKLKITVHTSQGFKNFSASFIYEFPNLRTLTVLNSSLVTRGGNHLVLRGEFSNGVSRTIHRRQQYPGFRMSQFRAPENNFKQLRGDVLELLDAAYFEDSIPVRICHVSGVCAENKVQLIINSQENFSVRGKTGSVGTSNSQGNGSTGETPEPIVVLIYQEKDRFFYQIQIGESVQNKVAGLKSEIKINSIGGNGGNGARLYRDCSDTPMAEGGDAGNGGDIFVYYFGQLSAIKNVFEIKSIPGQGGQGGYLEYCNKLPLGGYNGLAGEVEFIEMELDEIEAMKEIFGLD